MKRSRKKKSIRTGGIFRLLLLIAVIAGAAFGGRIYIERYMLSSEQKPLTEWLEADGSDVRVYLNDEAAFEFTAKAENGHIYLPADYICSVLNRRFYMSDTDGMLSYTRADETIDADASSVYDGAPVLKEIDGVSCILLDYVMQYTNIGVQAFCGEDVEAKRVFIRQGGTAGLKAITSKKTRIRSKRDTRSPYVGSLPKGEELIVSERADDWCSVVSADGISGYVRTKALKDFEEYTEPDSFTEPEIKHTLLDERPVIIWHGVYNSAGNARLGSMLKTAKDYISVISPTWLQISGADGALIDLSSREYVAEAHAAGLKVWASVDNFNQKKAVSDFDTGRFFDSAVNRRDFIKRLIGSAESNGYDGFNLDFEGLRAESGEAYVQFIRELSVECRKKELVLSVDNYVPYGFNDFYGIDEQSVFADYVVVMLYDENTAEIGSNSSASYVEYGLNAVMQDVPAERTIAGLPLYTRMWTRDGNGKLSSETMSIGRAAQFAAQNNLVLEWDDELKQNYGELRDGEHTKMLWMEDAASLSAKMDIVKRHNAGGIALWRLGYDTDDIWRVLYYRSR